MQLRKIKFLMIGKELCLGTNVPFVLISFRIAIGLRDRILNLPLMVAAVLTLLWRDVAGVTELTRMLAREGFL